MRQSAAPGTTRPLDIAWFEEPLPADDLGGHVRLRAAPPCRSPSAKASTVRCISATTCGAGACSIVQVDVGRIGGITPWLKVAHLAETFNVPVCPHFLMELHVALSGVPNARWVEYIPQLDPTTDAGMTIEDGYAVPTSHPGWDRLGLGRHRSSAPRRSRPRDRKGQLSGERPMRRMGMCLRLKPGGSPKYKAPACRGVAGRAGA